jgi:hypothetical protein
LSVPAGYTGVAGLPCTWVCTLSCGSKVTFLSTPWAFALYISSLPVLTVADMLPAMFAGTGSTPMSACVTSSEHLYWHYGVKGVSISAVEALIKLLAYSSAPLALGSPLPLNENTSAGGLRVGQVWSIDSISGYSVYSASSVCFGPQLLTAGYSPCSGPVVSRPAFTRPRNFGSGCVFGGPLRATRVLFIGNTSKSGNNSEQNARIRVKSRLDTLSSLVERGLTLDSNGQIVPFVFID